MLATNRLSTSAVGRITSGEQADERHRGEVRRRAGDGRRSSRGAPHHGVNAQRGEEQCFWVMRPIMLAAGAGGGRHPFGGTRSERSQPAAVDVGFLLAALTHAGLATLTHTPSPMGFLGRLLGRPTHERPYVVIPVGFPARDATVPRLRRKRLDEILVEIPAGNAGDP
jgi:hypothetical protein